MNVGLERKNIHIKLVKNLNELPEANSIQQ